MKYTILLLQIIFAFSVSAQTKPVDWSFEVEKLDSGNYIFTATATLEKGWALYSQHTNHEGPVPTSFSYSGADTIGDTKELSELISTYSDLFELEVKKFKNEAIFTQEFTPQKGVKSFSGVVNFMCCDNLKCLPPTDVSFDLPL